MSPSRSEPQRTLRRRVDFTGVGVHGGAPVGMSLLPADPNTGIVFVRIDIAGRGEIDIPALSSSIGATELCTVLGDPSGACVATVEHLLAALSGLGVDNAIVEIDGPEVPVMDGSAQAFVASIDRAGLTRQKAARRYIRVLKPVRVDCGSSFAEFRPYEGRRFDVAIAYDSELIGRQRIDLDLTPSVFRNTIARARTFGFMRDVERLWAAGFALGSSLENTLVIGDDGLVNPEGLRYPDEFARHKLLDAIGDLALAGVPILGLYRSFKGGHRVNATALAALLEQRDAWALVAAGEREARIESWPELMPNLLSPAFAPDVS